MDVTVQSYVYLLLTEQGNMDLILARYHHIICIGKTLRGIRQQIQKIRCYFMRIEEGSIKRNIVIIPDYENIS